MSDKILETLGIKEIQAEIKNLTDELEIYCFIFTIYYLLSASSVRFFNSTNKQLNNLFIIAKFRLYE
jgi:hypothetical protein